MRERFSAGLLSDCLFSQKEGGKKASSSRNRSPLSSNPDMNPRSRLNRSRLQNTPLKALSFAKKKKKISRPVCSEHQGSVWYKARRCSGIVLRPATHSLPVTDVMPHFCPKHQPARTYGKFFAGKKWAKDKGAQMTRESAQGKGTNPPQDQQSLAQTKRSVLRLG